MLATALLPCLPFLLLRWVRKLRENLSRFLGPAIVLSLGMLLVLSLIWRAPLFTILASFPVIVAGGAAFVARSATTFDDHVMGAVSAKMLAPVVGIWLVLVGTAWSSKGDAAFAFWGVVLMLASAGWLIYANDRDEIDELLEELPPSTENEVRRLARALRMIPPRVGVHRDVSGRANPWMRVVRLSPFDIRNLAEDELRFHLAQQMAFVRQYRRRAFGTIAGVMAVLGALVGMMAFETPEWVSFLVLVGGFILIGFFFSRLQLPYEEQIYQADAAALKVTGDVVAAKGAIRRATLMQWHNAPPVADWIPAHAAHRIERLEA